MQEEIIRCYVSKNSWSYVMNLLKRLLWFYYISSDKNKNQQSAIENKFFFFL